MKTSTGYAKAIPSVSVMTTKEVIKIAINISKLLFKGIDGKIELLFSGINKIRKNNDINKYLELISFFTTKIIIMKNKKIISNKFYLLFIIYK